MKKILVGMVLAATVLLSGCSSWEGQVNKKVDTFVDDHGRVCTALKWADSSSIDCDWPVDR